MSRAQQTIMFFGVFMTVAFCLRPPYKWERTTYFLNSESGVPHQAMIQMEDIGHLWIWNPPRGWNEQRTFSERISHVAVVDWPRLGIYVGLTAIITLFLAFAVFRSKTLWKPN